jgi:hypothetical protein
LISLKKEGQARGLSVVRDGQWLTIDNEQVDSSMKMATLNISLPPAMAAFVRTQSERDCGNVSEYFRSLVREKMREEIEADLHFLESNRAGALAGPSTEDIAQVLALQKRVRKDLARARRP